MTYKMKNHDLPDVPETVHSRVMETLELVKQMDGAAEEKKVIPMPTAHADAGEKTGKRRRHRRSVAAAAVLVAAMLGTTAYAAVRYWGLGDFLSNAGLKETQEAAQMIQDVSETQGYSNEYADYTVREALRDGNLLYLVTEVKPKQGYLIVPEDFSETSPVSWIGITGDEELTVGEYAQSLDKTILYGGVSMAYGGAAVSVTRDARLYEDGTIYFCLTGVIEDAASDDIDLTVTGTVSVPGDRNSVVTGSGTYTLQNAETIETEEITVSAGDALEEAGLKLETVTLRRTRLGLYADISWQVSDSDALSESEEDAAGVWSFSLADADGSELAGMPYYAGSGTTVTETDTGITCQRTLAYQRPADGTSICMKVLNTETGQESLIELKTE